LEVLRRECQTFLGNWKGSGRATFNASGSNHDDTIAALGLALVGINKKFASLVATARRRVLARLGQRDELIENAAFWAYDRDARKAAIENGWATNSADNRRHGSRDRAGS
jgi:hypothetical protein